MTAKAQWELIQRLIGKGRVLLYGPPGTGKTTTALYTLSGHGLRGRPRRVYNVYITPETSAAEIMGFFAPDESGAFCWRDGPVTAAMRRGSPLVINEINDVGGDAETALMGVLDDPKIAQYELTSGEFVRPAEGFSVVATMNGDPQDLRPAILDRMDYRFEIDEPHPDAFDALPRKLRTPAKRSCKADGNRRLSIRPWNAYAQALEMGLSEKEAAHAVFGVRAGEILSTLKLVASEE